MKRRIQLQPHYAPSAAQLLQSDLQCITRARMGEQRDDVRDHAFSARFWLQVAKWEGRFFGWSLFASRPLFVWTGVTFRTPVLP